MRYAEPEMKIIAMNREDIIVSSTAASLIQDETEDVVGKTMSPLH